MENNPTRLRSPGPGDKGVPSHPCFHNRCGGSLSQMLQLALNKGQIRGVYLPNENLHLLENLYADDINLICTTNNANIIRCRYIFNTFGLASGLYYNWECPTAVYISRGDIPHEFLNLNWNWERGPDFSKLLGFHIGEQISHWQMI